MLDRALKLGLIERVERDEKGAKTLVADARTHLDSAALLLAVDQKGAYQLAYDAARKAITAHLLAQGLRISKSKPGARETVGRYGVAEIATETSERAFRAFDQMRLTRNKAEYGPAYVGERQARAALENAQTMVEAVAESLGA